MVIGKYSRNADDIVNEAFSSADVRKQPSPWLRAFHRWTAVAVLILAVLIASICEYQTIRREAAIQQMLWKNGFGCASEDGWLRHMLPETWRSNGPLFGDQISCFSFWKYGRVQGPIDDVLPYLQQLRALNGVSFVIVGRVVISEETLAALKKLHIKFIVCHDSECDSETFRQMGLLPELKEVNLFNCKASAQALKEFRRDHPDITVTEWSI